MIPRISKGASASGALGYDHGPGRRDEHENPHKVAGNVPGRRWQDRARAIDQHMRTARPEAVKPLHRTSLRAAETDRQLTDREWKQIAETYVRDMGFGNCPWEATRHAHDHIHITVSRVQWDGKLARTSHDYAKAQTVCRKVEREHGLTDASRKFNRERPQVSKGERESAARRGVAPEKEQLRRHLREAELRSAGTRAGYEAALSEKGIHFRVNVAKTGRVSGYSYGLDGHRDQDGQQVFFKGSQLGKEFSWLQSQKRLDELPARHTTGIASTSSQRGGMTREEARAEAARRATQRTQQPSERSTQRTQRDSGVALERSNESPAPGVPMTREEARAEAARRAIHRENSREANEQEGERER